MRFVVISQATDLQALQKMLFPGTQPAATVGSALERLQRLNPHVDLHHLAADTVLLLPDLPGLDTAQGRVIGYDVIRSLSSTISDGLKTIGHRIQVASDALDAERSAVESAIDTEVVQRMMGDETLRREINDSRSQFTTDQDELRAAAAAVENLQKGIASELAALGQLLGFSTQPHVG